MAILSGLRMMTTSKIEKLTSENTKLSDGIKDAIKTIGLISSSHTAMKQYVINADEATKEAQGINSVLTESLTELTVKYDTVNIESRGKDTLISNLEAELAAANATIEAQKGKVFVDKPELSATISEVCRISPPRKGYRHSDRDMTLYATKNGIPFTWVQGEKSFPASVWKGCPSVQVNLAKALAGAKF